MGLKLQAAVRSETYVYRLLILLDANLSILITIVNTRVALFPEYGATRLLNRGLFPKTGSDPVFCLRP